ncbi:hypothetical protein M885DRAFT_510379 [Pelagophyceae sp. CCMP2097]|nr:hypothetical protein M885DRAFT_510379 [Pelagophyceae sp. CCMP2097]
MYAPSLFASPALGARERSASAGGDSYQGTPFDSQRRRNGGARDSGGVGAEVSAHRGGGRGDSSAMRQPFSPRFDVPEPDEHARSNAAPPTASLLTMGSSPWAASASKRLACSPTDSPRFAPMELSSPMSGGKDMRSPRNDAQSSLATSSFEQRAEAWIVVFGFPATAELEVLRKLAAFGDVVEHVGGRGNWAFVRFGTRWQAEKALAHSAIWLDSDSTVLVGALRLTADVAQRFGFDVGEDGSCGGAAVQAQGWPGAQKMRGVDSAAAPAHRDVVRGASNVVDVQPRVAVAASRAAPSAAAVRARGLCARLASYLFSC